MESSLAPRDRRAWAWLPAILVIVATMVTAAGVSMTPSAKAIGADLDVVGTVAQSLNFTGCGASITFTNNFTTGGPEQVAPTCAVSFDTNNEAGAKVDLTDDDGVAPFFCNYNGTTCGDKNQFDNATGSFAALTAGQFGAALQSVSGSATGGVAGGNWNVDANNSVAAGDASFYPILPAAGAATQVCETADSTAAAGCVIAFGGEPKPVQNAGTYKGVARIEVTTQ
jgi:hypothetical protein